ncbi:hypothetical protein YC2023_099019 [Brassica napus]
MRDSTVRSGYKLCWFLLAGLGRVVGSHGSFHTEIEEPDLTRLISHLLTRDLAETILRQPYDEEYERIGSKVEAYLKCRPLKTRENKVFGLSIRRHNCLPSITVLKSVMSLNPKPPSSLATHTLSHDFQCMPLILLPGLHQNCDTALVNFFTVALGK